jgi:beta-glucosidase
VAGAVLALGLLAAGLGGAAAPAGATTSGPSPTTLLAPTPGAPAPLNGTPPVSSCPWLRTAMDRKEAPSALAALVLRRMTLDEKLGELVLGSGGGYENLNQGVARLCIPRLTLQDGPQGLAYGDTDVTQLPAPLALAATFDTSLARQYGQVLGAEAKGQGIDVVQSPNLNLDRVPQNGRGYEGFGEDPLLVADTGVAEIEGIQAEGTLAQAKHFAVYNQETNRGELDAVVSERALQELYLPPFKAAVQLAHVASVMCAYPQLNGVYQCQDPTLDQLLEQWGFTGFVRSDLGAVHDPQAALAAGTDLIKPAGVARLATAVRERLLPVTDVDDAVSELLTSMFAAGLIGRDPAGSPGTPVDTLDDGLLARQVAERSAVLLKDQHGVLPIRAGTSVAVIGAAAGPVPVTSGYGSSYVTPSFTTTALPSIRDRAGDGARVTFADGGSTTHAYPPIPSADLAPSVGTGHGLTLQVAPSGAAAGGTPLTSLDPDIDVALRAHPSELATVPSTSANPRPDQRRSSAPLDRLASPGRTDVDIPSHWTSVTATWTGTLTPPRSGLYGFSLLGSGGATLSLDGTPVVSDPLTHAHGVWSASVTLTAGHPYQVHLSWVPFDQTSVTGQTTLYPSSLALGWEYASPAIARAVAAARSAKVAVVVAGDYSSEGYDRPSLALPGDQDALIAAVAAANPRTVVVLETGGPVLMPWLPRVAGVVEAWYGGEESGTAVAAVLYGDVDPSGRLPVTFPVSDATAPVATPAQWPGIDLVATYSEDLEVGYRYYHATGTAPLFPFGYGLSYTTFRQRLVAAAATPDDTTLTVAVTNTGRRAGTDVPQAYLTFPAAADEPPAQLVAYASVEVPAGRTRTVRLTVPSAALRSYQGSAWTTVPGTYTLAVGESSADQPLRTTFQVP